jgi:Ca2+-binding EF-hand superfamily protein
MKKILGALTVLILATRLLAQSNEPVRLALITETDEASAASDVLTAQLSGNPMLHLLERNEIEKVYREQGLSAANRDYLKLGRILGADGLLIFDIVRTKPATNLMARLIAVKPGVVLTDGSFPWPLKDIPSWAESVATYLNSFLPKLALLPKDAIPISVVNLRSAVQAADAPEMERQLKLLTIQRLSEEHQFFVLERQRMQLLGEEKELKSDESAFWDGSYLLDGTVDQNGYSKETITINARLTPPKGGAPLPFEVSGSRTNLAEVINRLAAKVTELLKVQSSVPEWNAADEAAQYFNEAKWALRWGSYAEAQAAAESAWALGRRDANSAMLRVRTYMISPDAGKTAIFYPPKERPDAQNIGSALQALEIYNESIRNLPPNEPKVDSDWYRLGLDNLTVASRVLQVFNWSPDYYEPVSEKLAELRATVRSTAALISRSSSVHDSYFVGDHVAASDELHHFEEQPSIFSLKLDCGCLWQETPENCVAIYRELMSSPVFCYLHDRFWFRDSYHNSSLRVLPPHLIAWNETDQKRIPQVWNEFVQELNASTNVLLQLEAKALQLADANSDTNLAVSFTNFFKTFFEDRDTLVANNVEVLYLEWRTGDLIEHMRGDSASDTKDSLRHIYYSEYRPKLEAMDREYRDKTVFLSTFEKQKQYLKDKKPYDFFEFTQLFGSATYSKAQALEIQPLFAAYISNLVTQSKSATGLQKTELEGAVGFVGLQEDNVNRILHPLAPQPHSQPEAPQPAPVAKVAETALITTNPPEIVTNVITISKFKKMPLDNLYVLNGPERLENSNATITAHHWLEGKLLLDFQYSFFIALRDDHGVLMDSRNEAGPAIAIFDPATEHWTVIGCPQVDIQSKNNFYHRSALLQGELFNCDGGQIRKYDFPKKQWQVSPVTDGNNYELFVVNGHLYAASRDIISEILDDGKSTRILASARRNPPASKLDGEDFGIPTLFEGPNHSLRVCALNKIFSWTGDDWQEDSAAPPDSSPPEIFPDGALFRREGSLEAGYQNGIIYRQTNGVCGVLVRQDEFFRLAKETNVATRCLKGNQDNWRDFPTPGRRPVQPPKTFWEMPANLLPNLPAALRNSDLYLLQDLFAVHVIVNDHHQIVQPEIKEKDEYNARLLCFSRDLPKPLKVFLKFDAPDGYSPAVGINPGSRQMFPGMPAAWMFFSANFLFCGLEEPDNLFAGGSGRIGSKPGIWMIPLGPVESAVAAQKQIQLEQKAKEWAAADQAQKEKGQAQKNLLAKYDYNHNGIIDPDEREEALDDPAFIESELDTIDANHNGRLDAEELVWFDANQNKILEPKEQAGIEIAQHLLAERLLKKFDANGDGFLDQSEFNDMVQSSTEIGAERRPGFSSPFPDVNRDRKIDLGELESFLKQQTQRGLRVRGGPPAALFNQSQGDASQPFGPRQLFKAEVEFYWQNPGGINHGSPFNRGIPPAWMGATNGMPNNKTP